MNIGRATARTVGFMAFVLLALPVSAQERGIVTGQVTDANSLQPLVGAQIVIDGTTIGGLTNQDGRYRLQNIPVGPQQIRAILIGYEPVTQDVTIVTDDVAVVDFQLNQSAITLDAVVVTAVGEQRKRELGNTVGVVSAAEVVEVAPVTNMASLIQGRTAGVTVMGAAGSVGMGSRIRIRGSNSVSLSNEPLVYIDGVRVDNSTGGVGLGGQVPSRLDDINPENIESIEIVKGPSAATLYGTEAANGVIRITTKRGRAGATQWNFWVERGVVTEPNDYPLNYAGFDAAGDSCLLDNEAQGLCTQTGISTYQVLDDPRLSPIDDGMRAQYGFDVRGGSENINYYVSAELESEEAPYSLPAPDRQLLIDRGIRINDQVERPQQLDRVSVRGNINAQVAEDATLSLNAGYVSSNLSATGNDNNSFGFLPSAFFGGAFPDNEAGAWGFQRPAELFGRDALQDVERFMTSLQGTWTPLEWLSARANAGLDYTNRHDISFFPRDLGVPGQANLGQKDSDFRNIYQYTADASGTASFDLTPAVSSKTSVGVQYFRRLFDGTDAQGIDIVNGAGNISAAAQTFADETTTEDKTAGVFVEQQFGLNDRLFVTGAVRADDNSAFGQDFDLIYYPKASVSWIASEESFFPEIGFLDQFRVRGAWGRSGLQPQSDDAIRTLAADAITDPGDNTISGVSIGEIGNALLKPEKSSEIELGFDADMLDGRLGVEFTYYDKTSEDALVERNLPPSFGASTEQWVNLGKVSNSGFELGINATVLDTDNYRWDLNLSGSINENELVTLGEGVQPIGTTERHVPGFPLGGRWDFPINGFSDADGNGIITTDELMIGDTLEFIGPGLPERDLAISTSVTLFDRVRLYGLLDHRGDYYARDFTSAFRCRFLLCDALVDRSVPLADQARAVATVYHGSQTTGGYVDPADFWKLREVSATFFIPEAWVSRINANRASLTVTGRNLATWTDYRGLDPEINSGGADDNFGVSEFLTQPPVRYWTLRLNLGF